MWFFKIIFFQHCQLYSERNSLENSHIQTQSEEASAWNSRSNKGFRISCGAEDCLGFLSLLLITCWKHKMVIMSAEQYGRTMSLVTELHFKVLLMAESCIQTVLSLCVAGMFMTFGSICLPQLAHSKTFSVKKAWSALRRETNRSFISFHILSQNVKVRKIIKYKSSHRHSEVSGMGGGGGSEGGAVFGSEPSVSQAFWVLTFRCPCQAGHGLPL